MTDALRYSDDTLDGEVTETQVLGWREDQWRGFQFRHMVRTNKRLSTVEKKLSWRVLIAGIPWGILGAVLCKLYYITQAVQAVPK